jgi:hypothetical protein
MDGEEIMNWARAAGFLFFWWTFLGKKEVGIIDAQGGQQNCAIEYAKKQQQ